MRDFFFNRFVGVLGPGAACLVAERSGETPFRVEVLTGVLLPEPIDVDGGVRSDPRSRPRAGYVAGGGLETLHLARQGFRSERFCCPITSLGCPHHPIENGV